MTNQEQVENILSNFDFKQVAKVMKQLNWYWKGNTKAPSILELQECARWLLEDIIKTPYITACATGGFHAQWYGENRLLQLSFEITSYIATQDTWE